MARRPSINDNANNSKVILAAQRHMVEGTQLWRKKHNSHVALCTRHTFYVCMYVLASDPVANKSSFLKKNL